MSRQRALRARGSKWRQARRWGGYAARARAARRTATPAYGKGRARALAQQQQRIARSPRAARSARRARTAACSGTEGWWRVMYGVRAKCEYGALPRR